MQRAYFLGGATPDGFETPFPDAQKNCYGFYLKGGPGTGKSTLMKKIAAAFSGEQISVYHCASDPRSLDAVVLENRRVFIADATAPHEMSTPLPYVSGELIDLAAGLSAPVLAESEDAVCALYAQNQAAHAQARKGLSGIGAMEDMVTQIGKAALLEDKLTGYAARLAKRLFGSKSGDTGTILHRQCCAITPQGRLTFCPAEYDIIVLDDPCRAASQILLRLLAEKAAALGKCCEVTASQTQSDRPLTHLIIPEQKLVILTAADQTDPELRKPAAVIKLQRFYDAECLRKQRTLARFCTKTAEALETQTVAILSDALRIHDALESYYIRALNPVYLDQTTASLVGRILAKA